MGSGSSKKTRGTVEEERRLELLDWVGKTHFSLLPQQGLEQFDKFLNPDNQRRLKFWMDKSMSIKPEEFASYIEDGPTMLTDVEMDEDDKPDLIQKARDIADYVQDLRAKMEPDLNSKFIEFKEKIRKDLSKLPK